MFWLRCVVVIADARRYWDIDGLTKGSNRQHLIFFNLLQIYKLSDLIDNSRSESMVYVIDGLIKVHAYVYGDLSDNNHNENRVLDAHANKRIYHGLETQLLLYSL